MTTTAHHPSPADLARRPAPAPAPATSTTAAHPKRQQRPAPELQPYTPRVLTPAEAVAPGKLHRSELLRPMFQQGVRLSRMQPHARLVALTLLGYANFQTGLIHERWTPTTEELAYATGLTTEQVQVQIEVLTQRGWAYTRALKQGPRAGQTALQMCVPAFVLEQLRARKDQDAPAN